MQIRQRKVILNKINKISLHNSMNNLAQQADAFILDIWGVLWDGLKPYKHSIRCLEKIRALGKPIALLSNAPRRSEVVSDNLKKIGISSDLYDFILSSGEICRRSLVEKKHHKLATFSKYFFIGLKTDEALLKNSNFVKTSVSNAEFILMCGLRNLEDHPSLYKNELEMLASKELPLVCANPDKVIVRLNGSKVMCAGILASYYEKIGGEVIYFGKPFQDIYDLCYNRLLKISPSLKRDKILAIGDSLYTDIAGAKQAGMNTLLTSFGIHSFDIGVTDKQPIPDTDLLNKLFKSYNVIPDAVITDFCWISD